MRLFISGLCGRCWRKLNKQFEERTGHRILERYGIDGDHRTRPNPYDGPHAEGNGGHTTRLNRRLYPTTGIPRPRYRGVELKICDPEPERPCPRRHRRRPKLRGQNVFHRAIGANPEKTAAELREDGLFINRRFGADRITAMCNRRTRQEPDHRRAATISYRKEVEQVLDDHPACWKRGDWRASCRSWARPSAWLVADGPLIWTLMHCRKPIGPSTGQRLSVRALWWWFDARPANTMG